MSGLWCWYFLMVLAAFPSRVVLIMKDVRIKQFQCYDHPYSHTVLEQCTLQTPRKGPQLITLVLRTRNLVPRVFIDVTVYSQYQYARTYLFGTTIDYCKYMAATESFTNPVAKMVHAVAERKFPQALLQCPVFGVVNVTNMIIDENLLPPIMPTGRFHTTMRLYNKRNETLLAWISDMVIFQTPLNQTFSLLG